MAKKAGDEVVQNVILPGITSALDGCKQAADEVRSEGKRVGCALILSDMDRRQGIAASYGCKLK
jgi:dipeptidase